MKKLLALFLLAGFILWVLPLGFFIKPSQQKLACDGQRAICMCHVAIKSNSLDKALEPGIVLKAGSPANRENSAGASNYFVSAKSIFTLNMRLTFVSENRYFFYKSPFLLSLEHVPKI